MRIITLFILFGIFIFSCEKRKNDDFVENKIDKLVKRYGELKRFSGAIIVSKNDTIVYDSNFGLADYEHSKPFTNKTAFKIGILSEIITKNIVEELALKKKINLNDSISDYIPELNIKYTIQDLLNHQTHFPSTDILIEKLPDLEYNFIEPVNSYKDSIINTNESAINYNILGLLIERVSKKSFQENLDLYSDLLDLKNTHYSALDKNTAIGYQYHNYRNNGLELQKTSSPDLNVTLSSRGIKSTTKDLLKIAKYNDEKVIDVSGYMKNDGFSFSLYNNPKNETCIIILSNFRHPVAKEITNGIDSILKGRPYKVPLKRQPFDINRNLLSDYEGKYALNKHINFDIITRNDSLYTILGSKEVYLIPQSKNQFYMPDRDAALRFLTNDSGIVDRVELLDGFIKGQIAKRIKYVNKKNFNNYHRTDVFLLFRI
ncbi:serine hydrolase domain-containing protein [Winogradskyella maritima]|uniref:Serine hydrolase domain-containing protein n=1 Tax=Winogradskyella maritima TaxID=1517766 RepID=A0ABV8AG62_9FLAO|nr:serine hydrolase domain-containing protein [Winogradskyella maritima]